MPSRPPRRVQLNLAPRKSRVPGKTPKTSRTPKRSGKTRGTEPELATLYYWIAGGLVVVLGGLIVLYFATPEIQAWFAAKPKLPEKTPSLAEQQAIDQSMPLPTKPAPAPIPLAPPPGATTVDDERLKMLKEMAAKEKATQAKAALAKAAAEKAKAAQEIKSEVEKPLTAAVAPEILPPQPASSTPLAPPRPSSVDRIVPVRALPLNPDQLTTERIAAYQVALERRHFSCGFIDGDQGMRTQRMLRAFQASRALPQSGFLDPATRIAIGEPGEPFQNYAVSVDDVSSIMPKPSSWIAKSKATRLGYNDIWELLAEKFHCTRSYLKALNPGVVTPVAGTDMIGPKVRPAEPIERAASLRISLSDTSIEALDRAGRIIAFFPCSIAKDKNKRPHGLLTVKVVDPHPDYTFDPALFADAAKAEGITHKMTLPPGPRNPVGTTWIGLSLPGYGIHGTPEPENISRTQSHGCFRLANWNAEKVIKMVDVGTPVEVVP